MATMNVLDAAGSTVAVEKPLTPGRSAAATSRPVALSTEDKTALDALATQTTSAAILAKIIAAPATEAKQDAAITQETAINTVLGTTAGAAVTTSVAGTIQGYLRGIVSLLVSGITVATHAVTQSGAWVLSAGTALIGKVGIDQTTDGTTNKVAADLRLAGSAAATGAGASGATVLRTTLASDSPGIIGVGTAGSPSANVLSQQGVDGGTPLKIGGTTIVQSASSTITRPADTTAYASGDLVANSVTAGSVAALQFSTLARISGGSGVIVGARIQKSTAGVTGAAFRVHYFDTIPTFTSAGDNSALSTVVVASAKGYLGYVDIPAMVGFSDVAWGTGAPDNSRGSIPFKATAQIIYAIVEARGAYTSGSAEVFTVSTFALQD